VEKWAEVKDLDRMAETFEVPKSAMLGKREARSNEARWQMYCSRKSG